MFRTCTSDLMAEVQSPSVDTSARQNAGPATVTSWRSFSNISEIFIHDERGKPVFSRTTFITVDEESGRVYYGSLETPKKQISLEEARGCLHEVPANEIYPKVAPSLSVASASDLARQSRLYIKRPRLLSYHYVAGTDTIASRFLDEACLHERLHQNPHPNVIDYWGCVVRDGRVTGLAMPRYHSMLSDRQVGWDTALPEAACFEGIVAGVEHLHSLGLAHNDINPSNIMLDEDGHPVIIDLGSCKPFGQELTELGTPGWNEGFHGVSTPANDSLALRKIHEWLALSHTSLKEADTESGASTIDIKT